MIVSVAGCGKTGGTTSDASTGDKGEEISTTINENSKNTDPYSKIKENTVDAEKQLSDTENVRFINQSGSGKRIMFVGNSITLHGKNADIGWYNECGMAASKPENDYVHILMRKIQEKEPDAQFCICQVSEWERNYKNGEAKFHLFENAQKFNADIIVARFIENCPTDSFDSEIFKKEYGSLLGFLNGTEKADIILTTGFWRHPGDEVIIEYGKENNLPYVELGDLGANKEMIAGGLFNHAGVASHPGDRGMNVIAIRIFIKLKNFL